MERPTIPDRLPTTALAAGTALGALAVYRLTRALRHEKDKANSAQSVPVDFESAEQVAGLSDGPAAETASVPNATYFRQPRYEDQLATVAQTVFS